MSFRSFEDIEACQNARAIAKEIYLVSRLLPFEREFALKDQIRKSAVSILSNIAEGFERDGNAEFIQSSLLQKALVASYVHSFILPLTADTSMKRHLSDFPKMLDEFPG